MWFAGLGIIVIWALYGIFVPCFFETGVAKSGTWGDTFGALSALINGFALLATAFAGIYIYRTYNQQVKEVAENRIYKELDNFAIDKEGGAKRMNQYIDDLYHSITNTVRREYGKVNVPNDETIVGWFFGNLELELIRDYSINSKTPRLNPLYVKYFKHIEAICYLFIDLKKDKHDQHLQHLRSMLISRMNDGELQMVCYYYFLFYDVVNSDDKDVTFKCENPVKMSGLFDGKLPFSDDFSRNIDPREDFFDNVLKTYHEKIAKYRRDYLADTERLRTATPDGLNRPDQRITD